MLKHVTALCIALASPLALANNSVVYYPLPQPVEENTTGLTTALADLNPACEEVPSVEQVRQGVFKTRTYIVSRDIAARLGNVFQILSGDGGDKKRALIHETSQSTTCASVDGKATLEYGYAFRIAFALQSTDASLELTIPALAASATLSNTEGEIVAGLWGINSNQTRSLVSRFASLKLGVESFAEIQKTLDAAVNSVSNANIEELSVARLGVISVQQPDSIETDIVRAFAMDQIASRVSCNNAARKSSQVAHVNTIIRTYEEYANGCSAQRPGADAVARAKTLLGNFF